MGSRKKLIYAAVCTFWFMWTGWMNVKQQHHQSKGTTFGSKKDVQTLKRNIKTDPSMSLSVHSDSCVKTACYHVVWMKSNSIVRSKARAELLNQKQMCNLRKNVKTDSSLMPVSGDLIHVDRLPLARMKDCCRLEWAKNIKHQLYRIKNIKYKAIAVSDQKQEQHL